MKRIMPQMHCASLSIMLLDAWLKGPRGLELLYGLHQLRLPHAEEGPRKESHA